MAKYIAMALELHTVLKKRNFTKFVKRDLAGFNKLPSKKLNH